MKILTWQAVFERKGLHLFPFLKLTREPFAALCPELVEMTSLL
jgi:hypothetical protein